MDPIIGGALIGGAASLLGGIMGRKSQKEQVDKSVELQREFAQHGIRWRVEDAKAAGLHPLFALGASTTGPTIPVMEDPLARSVSEAGQQFGRAVGAQETQIQRAQRHIALQIASAQIEKDRAMAGYYDSLASRTRQESLQSAPMVDPSVYVSPLQGGLLGSGANKVKVSPSEVTSYASSDPSLAAGKDVLWKTFKVGGREWILPNASNAGEALESVSESWPLTFLVIRENMKRNPNFVRENAHLIPFGEDAYAVADALSDLGSKMARSRRAREAGGVGDPGNREWRGRAMFRSFK